MKTGSTRVRRKKSCHEKLKLATKTIQKTLTATCQLSFAVSAAIGNFVLVKKLFAILLIMLYGVSSTGATVQLHYCCGKLKSIKLGSAPVKECGSKHKMGTKPCCETKQLSAKNQDQQDVYTISLGSKAPAEFQSFFADVNPVNLTEQSEYQQIDYSSPPLYKSLFILNCVFRI